MHTRLPLALPGLMIVLVGCPGPVTPSDGGPGSDGGADADVAPCTRDSDCGDQSLFCTQWRCRPGTDGTDARGCIEVGSPCEDGQGCDEDMDQCGAAAWCTEGRDGCLEPGDCDGDGHLHTLECGGDDCADDDADRYTGNPEICDDGHDEDCNPETVGMTDADSDGFVSSACCNGEQCGPDCDDTDGNVNPGAGEVCDGLDNDCDGTADASDSPLCPGGVCSGGRCELEGWDRVFGGGRGADESFDVAMDGLGNLYAVGSFHASARFGGPDPLEAIGRNDAFIVSYGA